MNIGKPKFRQRARRYAMQALYSWMLSGNALIEVEQQYLEERNPEKFDVEYFNKLLHSIANNIDELDNLFGEHVSRPIKEISPIELAILRLAVFELWQSIEIPYKVIINEAIELAKMFGADDSHKFINGVLDPMAKKLRKNEYAG